MKIWVDDVRPPPDETWTWFKHCLPAICALVDPMFYHGEEKVTEMSLDHDLGGTETTRLLVIYLIEEHLVRGHNCWPDKVVVHSQNPIGREWLESMIERYKS